MTASVLQYFPFHLIFILKPKTVINKWKVYLLFFLRINAKICLYEGVIVPTALYGTESRGMRSAERRKVNVLEIKCLRNLVGVSRMD